MSDESYKSPVPYGLVEHVHRTKSGKTVMAISLPIELRARMAQAAIDLCCSKLALVRTAIAQFLVHHEESRRSGQERALAAVSEVHPPIKQFEHPVLDQCLMPDPEPGIVDPGSTTQTGGSTVAVPEYSPVIVPEPVPEPVLEPEPAPVTIPLRKRTSKKS